MNFSRVIKAMAFVGLVGFGSQVLAGQGGAALIDDDTFETATVGLFQPQAAARGWTADAGDLSEIVTDFVTAFGPMPECGGYDEGEAGKLLELNTEGADLTFAAVSTTNATVYVDTMLKVVGSDSAPEITDAQVQTAVYLNTNDEKLYAWSSLPGPSSTFTNGWTQLATATVTNEEWICLQISIDYVVDYSHAKPMATVKVNGTAAGDAYIVANLDNSWTKRHVQSVSLRGTGMVDNFTVSQTTQTLALANIVTKFVDGTGAVIGGLDDTPGDEYLIGASSFDVAFPAAPPSYPQYEFVRAELVKPSEAPVLLTNGISLAVSADNGFVSGQTYVVQGVYAVSTFQVTVDYQGVGAPDDPAPATVPYGASFTNDLAGIVTINANLAFFVGANEYDQSHLVDGTKIVVSNITAAKAITVTGDYVSSGPDIDITDNDTLTFSAIVFGSPTNTVGFTAQGTVNSSPAVMYLIASTNLALGASGDFTIEVDVTATAGTPPAISGTIAIDPVDLTGLDEFFIKGLGTEP